MEKKDASFNTLFAVADTLGGCFPVFVVNFKGTLLCPDWSSDCRVVFPQSNGETRGTSGLHGWRNRVCSFGARSFSFFLNQNKQQDLIFAGYERKFG
ncbi:MAG TPA: hypothetical protein VGB02_03635 [Pyrinomonadaceae bacterium]|jgi:hypothetical protein